MTRPYVPWCDQAQEPVHHWRGLLLDSARTRWSPKVIREVLDLMSRYGLNRLHWHLTDDAGWRFAVPGWEELITTAAHLPRQEFADYTNVDHDKRLEALAQA